MTTASPTDPGRRFGAPYALQHRLLAGTLIGSPLLIGLALFYVLPTDEAPPVWVVLALVVCGVVDHFLIDVIGYLGPALTPPMDDDKASAAAMVIYQAQMVLRSALAESIAIVSIVLAFVLPGGGFWVYAVGAVVSLTLMGVHVWPWARPVGMSADLLESKGQPTRLREMFGHAPAGPMQRL